MTDPTSERTEIVSVDRHRRSETVAEHPMPVSSSEDVEAVVTDPFASRRAAAHKLSQAFYLLFGFFAILISLRMLLRLLGANPASPFAASTYAITGALLSPFAAVFPRFQFPGGVFEPESLVAIIVYLLLAWMLSRVVWLILDDTRSGTVHSARTHRTQLH